MAEKGKIIVTVQDEAGNTGRTVVTVPANKATEANAKKVRDYIKGHSDAKVVGYGISKDYGDDNTDEGKYDMCYQRLEYLFETGDGEKRRFGIPAPRDEDVDDYQQPTSDSAEDVKDLLNSIGAGSDWVYNGGGLKSRMPSKAGRQKEMTGI